MLATYAASRAALLLAAWFGRYFPRDEHYPVALAARRGWLLVPWRALDVWGRWDSNLYLEIARDGYSASRATLLAFFPGYPYLARAAGALGGSSEAAVYLAGLAVSNVAAVAGLTCLHQLARELLADEEAAGRSVLYLLAFPGALFLSCFYSEALFLALGAGAFLAACRERWVVAGVLGFFLALTRPVGVLFAAPLAVLHLERIGWDVRRLRWRVLALLLVPAGLGLHVATGWRITGDPLAIFHVQAGWGRALTDPWTTLTHPRGFHGYMSRIDGAVAVAFAALGVAALVVFRTRSLGLLLLLLVAPILLSGTLMSGTRFLAVAFPAFLLLARWGRHPVLDRAYLACGWSLQALMMAAWSQFYWLG